MSSYPENPNWNRHFADQYGHSQRTTFHKANSLSNKMGFFPSRGETTIAWIRSTKGKIITNTGKDK